MDLPRSVTSEDDVLSFRSRYSESEPGNSYDTTALIKQCNNRVIGNPMAEKAMGIFLDCKYWHLVDFCEDHLTEMNNNDAQLFREALILLAPQLCLGNYTERVVKLIGDPASITVNYFQDMKLLYDMFCCGAIETSRRGYSWFITETCISICDELQILADVLHQRECEEFNALIVRDRAYDGELREDVLIPMHSRVWPNLPDSFTKHKWLSNCES
jgi:hypothetical protein